MLTEETEAVGVVDEDAEIELLLKGNDLVELAKSTGHAVNALGDEEHAAAVLVGLLAGAGEDLLAVRHVVVAIFVLAAYMEADAVQKAGVTLGVIDDDVVTRGEGVDGRNDTLIAEIVQEGVFLLLELRELALESLVIAGVARHHTRAHRIREAPLCGGLGIGLADLRMVGQSEIIVETPVEHRHAVESHMRAELTLETRIHIVAESLLEILSDRTSRVPFDSVKNI